MNDREVQYQSRQVRALERIVVALEQLVVLSTCAPGTTALARLRVALLRTETPAQVVALWRRAAADLNKTDRGTAGPYVIERLLLVGAGTPGLENTEAAKAWLDDQIRSADQKATKPAGAPTPAPASAKAAGGRSR